MPDEPNEPAAPPADLSFVTTDELLAEFARRNASMAVAWIPLNQSGSIRTAISGHKATVLGLLTVLRRDVMKSLQ